MKLVLNKKPKNVRIIEGFPGFGLIGTIATEYLLEHLDTVKIGSIQMQDIPAMIAIHGGKVIEPISIHYNKKKNLVFIHAINAGKGLEWKISEMIIQLAKELTAKEIISLEGVGSPTGGSGRVFYFSNGVSGVGKKLEGIATALNEGIIVGVTGALLAKNVSTPLVALFAEARGNVPDSKAAAHVIRAIDAYTGLSIDPKPLLQQAQMFEQKLKGIVKNSQKAEGVAKKRHLSYVG